VWIAHDVGPRAMSPKVKGRGPAPQLVHRYRHHVGGLARQVLGSPARAGLLLETRTLSHARLPRPARRLHGPDPVRGRGGVLRPRPPRPRRPAGLRAAPRRVGRAAGDAAHPLRFRPLLPGAVRPLAGARGAGGSGHLHRHGPPRGDRGDPRRGQHPDARGARHPHRLLLGSLFGFVAGYFRDSWVDKLASRWRCSG
jgi:hypothetical protein